MLNRSPLPLAALAVLAAPFVTANEDVDPQVAHIVKTFEGRGVMADETPPTPPDKVSTSFAVRAGFTLDLMAAEPDLAQPLSASWDSRGRLWVVQYLQYPFPAGLKIVSYDQHLRAQFDKVPLPPPVGEKGADKITVFEDTDGDGFFDHHFDAITGLNITSSVLTGMDRIWVLNPPYLLSYPDADGDGHPEGDPKVALSGFGLEDTHSVATSLTWGVDGWLYGANGSTTTGNVSSAASRNVKWEGQCIWRYHPRTEVFEIYAEGGGNTFSLDIDSKGRVFSGTNNGKTRGMHYEQGSYGIKNWGKHGPLTNPYAFGWFEHMAHQGDDRRFAQAFTIYEGGLFGPEYEGKIIAPNSLQNVVHLSERLPDGTTFRTVDEEPFVTSTDRWFRPVWCGVGPDGAVYLADWYDTRLSHVSPIDDWDKARGRIYRLRPEGDMPKLKPFDLHTASPEALLGYLDHPNEWFRKQTVLEIGWRRLGELMSPLSSKLKNEHSLEALWALDLLDQAVGDDDPDVRAIAHNTLAIAGKSHHPHLRRWAVKMIGETGPATLAPSLFESLKEDSDPGVRAQLLATAKRLPAAVALPLLWSADGLRPAAPKKENDPPDSRLALLAWWALESKAETEREAVFTFLRKDPDFLATGLFRQHLAEKLARRYALAGGDANFQSCADLIALAPDDAVRGAMIAGIATAFEGGTMPTLPDVLAVSLNDYLSRQSGGDLTLALRTGSPDALKQALKILGDSNAPNLQRIAIAQTLAELGQSEALPICLKILSSSSASSGLKRGVLQAASRFDDPSVPEVLLKNYERQIAGDIALREDALRILASRLDWARQLIAAVNAWRVPAKHFTVDIVRALSLHQDPEMDTAIETHWQRLLATAPTDEKEAEATRVRNALVSGTGDPERGKTHFTARCALCHKLFDAGGTIGPELTGYDRASPGFWIENLINPSLEIREGFGAYVVRLKSGQILTGLMDAQDATGITLKDMAGNRTLVRQEDIASLQASPASLMPEGLTVGMSEDDLRDLFAYLMKVL